MLFYDVLDNKTKVMQKPFINQHSSFFDDLKERFSKIGIDVSIITVLPAFYYTEVVVYFNPYKSEIDINIPSDKYNSLMLTRYPDGVIFADNELKMIPELMFQIEAIFSLFCTRENYGDLLHVTNEFSFRFQDIIKEMMFEIWNPKVFDFYNTVKNILDNDEVNVFGSFEKLVVHFPSLQTYNKAKESNEFEKITSEVKKLFIKNAKVSLPIDNYINVIFSYNK